MERLYTLKERFAEGIRKLPDAFINGRTGRETAPHIVNASFPGIRSEVLLHALEDKGIYVSAGSACSSNKPAPSHTLLCMGLMRTYLVSSVSSRTCQLVLMPRDIASYTNSASVVEPLFRESDLFLPLVSSVRSRAPEG